MTIIGDGVKILRIDVVCIWTLAEEWRKRPVSQSVISLHRIHASIGRTDGEEERERQREREGGGERERQRFLIAAQSL